MDVPCPTGWSWWSPGRTDRARCVRGFPARPPGQRKRPAHMEVEAGSPSDRHPAPTGLSQRQGAYSRRKTALHIPRRVQKLERPGAPVGRSLTRSVGGGAPCRDSAPATAEGLTFSPATSRNAWSGSGRSPACRGRRSPAASGPIVTPYDVGLKAKCGPARGT